MEKKSIMHSPLQYECGITIDHVINAAKNIYYMLFEKMIQKERPPEPFFHLKINGSRNNFMP